MLKHNLNKGFTLIELSIVLVIIGLIVGGILVGRDLIQASYVRSEITQIQQYVTASATFRDKYGCLAGDCKNASQFIAGAVNGDGNGGIMTTMWGGTETLQFWYQLSKTKLIAGSYDGTSQQPPGIINPNTVYGVYYWPESYYANSGGTGIDLWDGWTPGPMLNTTFGNTLTISIPACTPKGGLTPTQAYTIDSKIDDGFPASGKIVQFDPWTGGGSCVIWDGGVTSLDMTTSRYKTTDTGQHSSLIYTNAFY